MTFSDRNDAAGDVIDGRRDGRESVMFHNERNGEREMEGIVRISSAFPPYCLIFLVGQCINLFLSEFRLIPMHVYLLKFWFLIVQIMCGKLFFDIFNLMDPSVMVHLRQSHRRYCSLA